MELNYKDEAKDGSIKIFNISFNQSYDSFTIASSIGFSIYSSNPYKLIAFRCNFSCSYKSIYGWCLHS